MTALHTSGLTLTGSLPDLWNSAIIDSNYNYCMIATCMIARSPGMGCLTPIIVPFIQGLVNCWSTVHLH